MTIRRSPSRKKLNKSLLEKEIFDLRESTQNDFDKKNNEVLVNTVGELNKPIFMKYAYVFGNGERYNKYRYEAYSLYIKSLDILVSSLHMARQRAFIESLALMRISLEAVSTSLHVYMNKEAYECYISGNYKSTKAIAFANKYVRIIGKIWGILSNVSVHMRYVTYGSRLKKDSNGKFGREISIDAELRKSIGNYDSFLLKLICLLSNIILKVSEIIFLDENGSLRLNNANFINIGVKTDDMIDKYYSQVLKVMEVDST